MRHGGRLKSHDRVESIYTSKIKLSTRCLVPSESGTYYTSR